MAELTILKFEKPNCAPCVAVSEMLDKAKVEHQKINYIMAIDIAQQCGIKSVPTICAVTYDENQKPIVKYMVRGSQPEDIYNFLQQVAQY